MKSSRNFALSHILMSALAVMMGLTLLPAGNSSGCTDNRSSIPLAGFYSSTTLQAISIDSVAIRGLDAPVDTVYLLAPGTTASEVYLPLRAAFSSTTFEIQYLQSNLRGLSDYVDLTYTASPYFASEECGAMYRYRITSLSHSSLLLDSVAVIPADSVITNSPVQNLRFYFRTSL